MGCAGRQGGGLVLAQLQDLVCREVWRQRHTLVHLLQCVHVVRRGRRGSWVTRHVESVRDRSDVPFYHEVPVSESRRALVVLYLTDLLVWAGGGGGGGGGRGGGRGKRGGGVDRKRDNLSRCGSAGLVFPVQFVEPEGESVPVLRWEGWVYECEGEELATLLQVHVGLTGPEEDLGEESHVLLPGIGVPRM